MNRGMHQKFTELQQVVEEEAWKFDRDTEAEDDDDVVQKGHWESPHTHRLSGKCTRTAGCVFNICVHNNLG